MPKVMPKRTYSVALSSQRLPSEQVCVYVLSETFVSVRKAVSCITQVTRGGWKAPLTIGNTELSGFKAESSYCPFTQICTQTLPVALGGTSSLDVFGCFNHLA